MFSSISKAAIRCGGMRRYSNHFEMFKGIGGTMRGYNTYKEIEEAFSRFKGKERKPFMKIMEITSQFEEGDFDEGWKALCQVLSVRHMLQAVAVKTYADSEFLEERLESLVKRYSFDSAPTGNTLPFCADAADAADAEFYAHADFMKESLAMEKESREEYNKNKCLYSLVKMYLHSRSRFDWRELNMIHAAGVKCGMFTGNNNWAETRLHSMYICTGFDRVFDVAAKNNKAKEEKIEEALRRIFAKRNAPEERVESLVLELGSDDKQKRYSFGSAPTGNTLVGKPFYAHDDFLEESPAMQHVSWEQEYMLTKSLLSLVYMYLESLGHYDLRDVQMIHAAGVKYGIFDSKWAAYRLGLLYIRQQLGVVAARSNKTENNTTDK